MLLVVVATYSNISEQLYLVTMQHQPTYEETAMYKERASRTRLVKEWADRYPLNTEFRITEAADKFRQTLPSHVSPSGFGGQSVARIMCEHCGWLRLRASVIKRGYDSDDI